MSDEVLLVCATFPVAVLAALPALRRRDVARAVRAASAVLLLGVVLAVLSATLRGASTPVTRVNLVPGAGLAELGHEDAGAAWNAVENLVGNVALFVPVGFLAVLALRRRVLVVTVLAAVLSVLIESTQLLVGNRWVDVDDVWLNTCGAFLGVLLATRLESNMHSTDGVS